MATIRTRLFAPSQWTAGGFPQLQHGQPGINDPSGENGSSTVGTSGGTSEATDAPATVDVTLPLAKAVAPEPYEPIAVRLETNGVGRQGLDAHSLTARMIEGPIIDAKPRPEGELGQPYAAPVSAVGSGALTDQLLDDDPFADEFPPSLRLHPSTGEITGTPTTSGTVTFGIRTVSCWQPGFGAAPGR